MATVPTFEVALEDRRFFRERELALVEMRQAFAGSDPDRAIGGSSNCSHLVVRQPPFTLKIIPLASFPFDQALV